MADCRNYQSIAAEFRDYSAISSNRHIAAVILLLSTVLSACSTVVLVADAVVSTGVTVVGVAADVVVAGVKAVTGSSSDEAKKAEKR